MDSKQKEQIFNYLKIINKDVEKINTDNPDLIYFCINEVVDRLCLYLNRPDLPKQLERIVANAVSNGLNKQLNSSSEGEAVISSISDNGQSISFSNEAKNYFASVEDNLLFNGYENIIKRYRRIKVVHPDEYEI